MEEKHPKALSSSCPHYFPQFDIVDTWPGYKLLDEALHDENFYFLLIQRPALSNKIPPGGWQSLSFAYYSSHFLQNKVESIEILLKHGAKPLGSSPVGWFDALEAYTYSWLDSLLFYFDAEREINVSALEKNQVISNQSFLKTIQTQKLSMDKLKSFFEPVSGVKDFFPPQLSWEFKEGCTLYLEALFQCESEEAKIYLMERAQCTDAIQDARATQNLTARLFDLIEEKGHLALENLLALEGSPNVRNVDWKLPVQIAIEKKDLESFKILLGAGASTRGPISVPAVKDNLTLSEYLNRQLFGWSDVDKAIWKEVLNQASVSGKASLSASVAKDATAASLMLSPSVEKTPKEKPRKRSPSQ